jgi:short-subunit dehydrogenase
MLSRGSGAILNVASTAAYQPVPYMSVYAATKHYVLAFSEALHEEWSGRGVAVTCLCPGATDTGFGARAGMRASFFESGETPEKVARVVLDALARGQRTVISGAANAVMANVARVLPSSVSAKMAAQMFDPARASA